MPTSPKAVNRQFPFVAGTRFKATDWDHAERAIKVFKELWAAVQAGRLSKGDVYHAFYYSTSPLISYRESWKCGQYWSVDAWKLALEAGKTSELGLVAEHVLPRDAMLQHVLSMADWDTAKQYLWANSFVCIITKTENQRLGAAKLGKVGFPESPWRRYSHEKVRIDVLDAECPAGTPLMTDVERDQLLAEGLLIGMDDAGVEKRDPLPPKARTRRPG